MSDNLVEKESDFDAIVQLSGSQSIGESDMLYEASLEEALVDLYLNVKIRSSEDI